MDWQTVIRNVAPVLGGVLGGPVGAAAVGMLANRLGLESSTVEAVSKAITGTKLTPEQEEAIRLAEIDMQKFAVTNNLDLEKLSVQNTQGAREANARIQESANASSLAKNAPYILDFAIVGGTLLLAYFIFFVGIPQQNKDIAFAAFGSLITLCGTIVNFHRGSSQGSKDMKAMVLGQAK